MGLEDGQHAKGLHRLKVGLNESTRVRVGGKRWCSQSWELEANKGIGKYFTVYWFLSPDVWMSRGLPNLMRSTELDKKMGWAHRAMYWSRARKHSMTSSHASFKSRRCLGQGNRRIGWGRCFCNLYVPAIEGNVTWSLVSYTIPCRLMLIHCTAPILQAGLLFFEIHLCFKSYISNKNGYQIIQIQWSKSNTTKLSMRC